MLEVIETRKSQDYTELSIVGDDRAMTDAEWEQFVARARFASSRPCWMRESTNRFKFRNDKRQHECPTCGAQCRCDVPRQYCVHCA